MTNLVIGALAVLIVIWIFRNHRRIINAKQSIVRTIDDSVAADVSNEATDAQSTSPVDPKALDYSQINRAYRIADMHFSRGDFKEAEKWFIKVLALHPEHTESLNRLGVIYIQNNNARRAELLYRKLLSITQKEPAYYCNYGRCLYNQGRLAEALEAYENAVKLDSRRPARLVSVGQIYYEQKNFERAAEYFWRALDLEPDNIEYLKVSAELAELLQDNERLHRSLKKIAEIEPYNEEVQEKLRNL